MAKVRLAERDGALTPAVWFSAVLPQVVAGATLDWSGVAFEGLTPEGFAELLRPFATLGWSPEELRRRLALGELPPRWRAVAESALNLPAEGISPLLARDAFARIRRVQELYRGYAEAFVRPANPAIREFLTREVEEGELLWREPFVELRRELARGEPLEALVEEGLLHPDAPGIFRQNPRDPESPPIHPYRHQVEALRAARAGKNVVVATGTGSGKSFAFGLPVIDYALRQRDRGRRGTKAILVYPMNALANDQFRDLALRLRGSGLTVALYTGDTPHTREEGEVRRRELEHELGLKEGELRETVLASRAEIRETPPDLLLTNYVMLELILTRREDLSLFPREHRGTLRFLVLDELHTYGGLKGADTALLIRRLKVHTGTEESLQFIGTSATLAEEEWEEALAFASRLFGAPVTELIRETHAQHPPGDAIAPRAPLAPVPEALNDVGALAEAFLGARETEPARLAAGLEDHPTLHWVRRALWEGPRAFPELVAGYARARGLSREEAGHELLAFFALAQYAGKLQVKLHEFYSQNVALTATLHDPPKLSSHGETELEHAPAFPVVFCRQCKNEFFVATREGDRFFPAPEFGETEGVVYLTPGIYDPGEVPLPENWLTPRGEVRREYRAHVPGNLRLDPDRAEAVAGPAGRAFIEVKAPFLFCPHCGIHYDRRPSEFSKLTPFGLVGRSTATDLILLGTLGAVAEGERKVIAFTDNRQDADFQAAHFSDLAHRLGFRQAALKAIEAKGEVPLARLGGEVLDYWRRSGAAFLQNPDLAHAMRAVLQLFATADAARNVQPNFPNLEEAGLVRYDYEGLGALADDPSLWEDAGSPPLEVRRDTLRGLLDLVRRREAVSPGHALPVFASEFEYEVRSPLEAEGYGEAIFYEPGVPAALFESAPSDRPRWGRPVALVGGPRPSRFEAWVMAALRLDRPLAAAWLRRVFRRLQEEHLLVPMRLPVRGRGSRQLEGWVLNPQRIRARRVEAEELSYCPKSRVPFHFEVLDRSPEFPALELRRERPPEYFQRLYAEPWFALPPQAAAHTAQVPARERTRLEDRFRDPQSPLSVLVATPTLELGVDIGSLANVYLRNVPPSPANYAQRSGRAGRRGQPALVQVFAGQGYRRGPHDQYFYRHPEEMIRGEVRPPRFLLDNERLIRAHIHAVVLEHLAPRWELPEAMRDLVEIEQVPELPLRPEAKEALLGALGEEQDAIVEAAARSLALEMRELPWLDEGYVASVVAAFPETLDRAFSHWRKAFAAIVEQFEALKRRIEYVQQRRERQKLEEELRALGRRLDQLKGDPQAENPLTVRDLLESEGFVPNYAFSSRAVQLELYTRDGAATLAREPLLALREFAPGNFVYYGGTAFEVTATGFAITEKEVQSVAQCPECGHPGYPDRVTGRLPDRCPRCGADLSGAPRLRALAVPWQRARRRRRVTSEEEERRRRGYAIVEEYQPSAGVESFEAGPLRLDYDHRGLVRSVNLGARASERTGFVLCRRCGSWLLSEEQIKKHPHREGRSGTCPQRGGEEDLVFGLVLHHEAEVDVLALYVPKQLPKEREEAYYQSLAWALWRAALVTLELEEGELGVFLEPGGTSGVPYRIVLYERVEGGLGALRSLLEGDRWERLVEVALDLLHAHEPEEEACEKACYRCLLSYHNQAVHHLLDRRLVLDDLRAWRTLRFARARPRARKERLLRFAESELERRFLKELDRRGLPLPDEAQYTVATREVQARYDFYYREADLGIFVDGPGHDEPARIQADARIRQALEAAGRRFLVFRHDQDWEPLFGRLKERVAPSTWEELLRVRPDLASLVGALKGAGVPPPEEVLFDLVGPDGSVIGQGLARWGKVVLVEPGAPCPPSGVCVRLEEAPGEVAREVKDALGSADRP